MRINSHPPINDWLRKFTYREGYEFVYFAPHEIKDPQTGEPLTMHEGHVLVLTPVWPDSRMQGATSRGRFTFPVPPDLFRGEGGEERFKRWFRQQIHHIEMHEADEWLLYEGERLWDPHATHHV